MPKKEASKPPSTHVRIPMSYDMTKAPKVAIGEGPLSQYFKTRPSTTLPSPDQSLPPLESIQPAKRPRLDSSPYPIKQEPEHEADDTVPIKIEKDDHFAFDNYPKLQYEFPATELDEDQPLQSSLTNLYIADLEQAFKRFLPSDITFIQPPRCCTLLGGEIVLQVGELPGGVTFDDLAASFVKVAQTSKLIISSWVAADGTSLHAKVALDAWKSTRVDRYTGSRIHDMGNNQEIFSFNRPQTIKITPGKHHGCPNVLLEDQQFQEYQTMSLHLMTSLRLSPQDNSAILHHLANHGLLMSEPYSHIPHDNMMFRAAVDALRQPYLTGMRPFLEPAHILPDMLKDLQANTVGVSEVRRNMKNKYLVVFYVHSRKFHERSRALGSSYFIHFDERSACQPQVHILETKAANLENCHVLTFDEPPTKQTIESAIVEARVHLGVTGKRTTNTKPIVLSEQLFRSDGLTERNVLDKFAAELKTALLKDKGSDFQITLKLSSDPPQTQDPYTYVVFTRQSAEESGGLKNTSVPRQATSILTNPKSPIRNLKANDRILVVVEVCSSHKHPLQDRNIFDRLPLNENLIFLSANPDRITRRHEEVDEVLKFGKWFSSGMDGARSEWFDVSEHADEVKRHLLLGRQRALQSSYYTSVVQAMTRCLDASKNSYVPELDTMKARINNVYETSSLHRILLCVRVSPNTSLSAKNDINTSLVRQQEFLNLMVPPELHDNTELLRADKVSATDPDFLNLLSDRLSKMNEPTLILSTTIERITRSLEHLSMIKNLSDDGHVFASLVWDSKMPIAASDPLKTQERSKGGSLKMPKIIPVVWSPCDNETQAHVQRHVQNAQDWVDAVSHTSFQGEARDVPVTMIAPTAGKILDRNHLLEWHQYLNAEASVPVNVIGNAAELEKPGYSKNGNKKKIPENYTQIDRKCATTGCENLAPANTQTGSYCKACFQKSFSSERQCWTAGCTNAAPFGGPTGKACLGCSRTNPDKDASRLCVEEGCTNLSPPGKGTRCTPCRTARGKVLRKAREARAADTAAEMASIL
ncbi:hypothetical protein KCU81_g6010, partial [Aureobasidium melanogenum]|uniref:Uncharacterized protein n=1 Tax=Aureobasidium melanogenum (strain CBS 110374) TaxID=1043003 RepID=A0A074W807_AURM1